MTSNLFQQAKDSYHRCMSLGFFPPYPYGIFFLIMKTNGNDKAWNYWYLRSTVSKMVFAKYKIQVGKKDQLLRITLFCAKLLQISQIKIIVYRLFTKYQILIFRTRASKLIA